MEIVNLAPNWQSSILGGILIWFTGVTHWYTQSSVWLGGILIFVSLHIYFNKLLMPLLLVCCFTN